MSVNLISDYRRTADSDIKNGLLLRLNCLFCEKVSNFLVIGTDLRSSLNEFYYHS